MNPIAHHPLSTPFAAGAFPGTSYQAEQTKAGIIAQKQSTDLTITTAEGDTVTLSLASTMEATAGIHRSQSTQDRSAMSTQTALFDYSSSRSLSLEIVGELSEEELADIREAVKTIGSMIDDFLSGDLKAMGEDGQLLKELDSLASLDAAFTSEWQVMVAEQEKVDIRQAAPQHHAHRRGHGRLQRLMNRIDRLTDDMAEQVKGCRGRRKHLCRAVGDLLGRYRRGEAENAPADDLGQTAIQAVQSSFVQKIQTVAESTSFSLSYAA